MKRGDRATAPGNEDRIRGRLPDELITAEITPETAYEYVEFWVRVSSTTSRGVQLHLPRRGCTRADPRPICDRSAPKGKWVAKSVEVYPGEHASRRICDKCLQYVNFINE